MREKIDIFSNSNIKKFFSNFFINYEVNFFSLDLLNIKKHSYGGGLIFINSPKDKNKINFQKLNNKFLIITDQHIESEIISKNTNILKSPIHATTIKSNVKKFLQLRETTYKYIKINNKKLTNNNNNQSCSLTDIENEILYYLFTYKNCRKTEINKKILNLAPTIESNSLDSHLSRIRKKFENIDIKIKIQTKIDTLTIVSNQRTSG